MKYVDKLKALVNEEQRHNTAYHAYTDQEPFLLHGQPQFHVLDFWRFQYAQLAGLHSEIAEFIVAKALHVDKSENSNYWTAYDMSYQGHRIEVKETSYVHPWNKEKVSAVRTFSIAPSNNAYWSQALMQAPDEKESRQSDIYVFCLNTNKNPQDPQPLNLDFWEFYVIPTYKINRMAAENQNPNQKKISLNVVKRLCPRVHHYDTLRSAVDEAIQDADAYYNRMYD